MAIGVLITIESIKDSDHTEYSLLNINKFVKFKSDELLLYSLRSAFDYLKIINLDHYNNTIMHDNEFIYENLDCI